MCAAWSSRGGMWKAGCTQMSSTAQGNQLFTLPVWEKLAYVDSLSHEPNSVLHKTRKKFLHSFNIYWIFWEGRQFLFLKILLRILPRIAHSFSKSCHWRQCHVQTLSHVHLACRAGRRGHGASARGANTHPPHSVCHLAPTFTYSNRYIIISYFSFFSPL